MQSARYIPLGAVPPAHAYDCIACPLEDPMRPWPLFALALLACAEPVDWSDTPVPWSLSDDGFRQAPAVDLSVGPVVEGEVVDFVVTGAEPLERVYFARGSGLGDGPCIGIAGDLCLGILGAPTLLGTATADGAGTARLTVRIPVGLAGLEAAIQAVILRGVGGVDSVASAPVAFAIEAAPTCDDGVYNGDEEGVDCGGSCIDACPVEDFDRDEDFESGDLSAFDWLLDGPAEWQITEEGCFEGEFCLRTSPLQAAGEVAGAELALSIREDSTLAFQLRTDTEEGEHIARLWIDDALALEVSGITEWTTYAFDVYATGPADPDTVFRWEYSRSMFVDPTRPARNSVWLDLVELPPFNTGPTVPVLSAPGNGVVVGGSPTLAYGAMDPDGDALTYVVEVDTDPLFSSPVSSGETFADAWTPDLADGVWFWRVRAKDDADYRFTPWSEVRTFEVDSSWAGPPAWLQHTEAQFATGTLSDAVIVFDAVMPEYPGFDVTSAWTPWALSPTRMSVGLPAAIKRGTELVITSTVLLAHNVDSAYGLNNGRLDGVELWAGSSWNPPWCARDTRVDNHWGFGSASEDLEFEMEMDIGRYLDWDRCDGDGAQFNVVSAALPGTLTSPQLVVAELFGPDATWTRLRIDADPGVVVTVLDELGAPVPDEVLPGNGALGAGTHMLWGLDGAAFPVIQLEATVDGGALRGWDVTGGESVLFDFDAADSEGWTTPDGSVSVADGVLRLEAGPGVVPRLEHLLSVPVPADRFTTATVRLRTSNNAGLDTPSWWWSSDYGPFDARRSLTAEPVFLLEFQDVTFDLTAEPVPPDEAWRGEIDGLRVQPAGEFVDPAAGWAEIEWIRLE
ncbi:MAG: hypothetical protein ACI8PZ_002448 [Myxococcota bacterium]